MRALLVGLGLGLALAPGQGIAQARSPVVRDVEGYAVAACLARQTDVALRRQGEGWGSVIAQRGRGDPALLRPIENAVAAAVRTGKVPVMREDGPRPSEVALPIMYCGEIVDQPAVRRAIMLAVARLASAYRRP